VAKIVSIPGLDLAYVKFYSVRMEGQLRSEFMRFVDKYYGNTERKTQFDQINKEIVEIGRRGARRYYFKDEDDKFGKNNTIALPKQFVLSSKNDFGLRIYGVWLSESVVLLLNGDSKTKQVAQYCPNVGIHFNRANSVAKQLHEAQLDELIKVRYKEIQLLDNDFNIDY
jgi:hypothetical protein